MWHNHLQGKNTNAVSSQMPDQTFTSCDIMALLNRDSL